MESTATRADLVLLAGRRPTLNGFTQSFQATASDGGGCQWGSCRVSISSWATTASLVLVSWDYRRRTLKAWSARLADIDRFARPEQLICWAGLTYPTTDRQDRPCGRPLRNTNLDERGRRGRTAIAVRPPCHRPRRSGWSRRPCGPCGKGSLPAHPRFLVAPVVPPDRQHGPDAEIGMIRPGDPVPGLQLVHSCFSGSVGSNKSSRSWSPTPRAAGSRGTRTPSSRAVGTRAPASINICTVSAAIRRTTARSSASSGGLAHVAFPRCSCEVARPPRRSSPMKVAPARTRATR